jgi:predicted dehydrogenase
MPLTPSHARTSLGRRQFLAGTVAAAALALAPRRLGAAGKPDKINLACCGIGNRGADVIKELVATGLANVVALCDTDMEAPHTLEILRMFPNVPRFRDFRQLFDKVGGTFDAVSIATPDFSHFPIAMLAMSQLKHVFCEKPMGQSFQQIELMMRAEKRYGVAAQMGNQGHSGANYFQFKAWTEAGIIKNVTQITAFMNSPRRWHGMKVDAPLPAQPIPSTLDWDAWLATAQPHEYNKGYVNGDWRSWYDFGNGALGDWGAHIFDTAHEFLELGLPHAVEVVKLDGWSPLIFPQASTLRFRFGARSGKPPVDLTWYDGQTNTPPLPAGAGGAIIDPNIPPPSSGSLDMKARPPGKIIYGEGATFQGGTHGSTLRIIGRERDESSITDWAADRSNHFKNFLLACRGEEKCRSSFAVAGPLCQAMALGVLAQRFNETLEFDAAARRITNNAAANLLLEGVPPRPDWAQYYRLA